MTKSSTPRPYLTLLAMLALFPTSACTLRDLDSGPQMISNFTDSKPLAGESELRATVRFRVGHIIVAAAPENTLYRVDVDYDSGRFRPELNYNAATQRLDFQLRGDGRLTLGSDDLSIGFGGKGSKDSIKNRLNLYLSQKVRLRLELTAGIGETKVNLNGLQTESLEIESGVSTTFISCESPNPVSCDRLRFRAGVGEFEALQLGNLNFRFLDFEGGVGSSRLDFSGQWRNNAEVSVKMGVGELLLKLPQHIAAEVQSEKRFLSGLHLESFTQRDGTYFSDNFEKAKNRVRFRLQTGIGSISVKWL